MYRDHTPSTGSGQRIAVVVPAYNEETLIGRVIETMPDYVDRIVVVDDDSGDGTAEAVRRCLPRLGERLLLIRHGTNQGFAVSGLRAEPFGVTPQGNPQSKPQPNGVGGGGLCVHVAKAPIVANGYQ